MATGTMQKVICSKCVMDTSTSRIRFDSKGVCNFCKAHDAMENNAPPKTDLPLLVAEMKRKGMGKEYDCIVGVSGGRDSTYTLYMAKNMGLRCLAVHLDNGWDSDIAKRNLAVTVAKLGVEIQYVAIDAEKFRTSERAFLEASVPDISAYADYGIVSVLYQEAVKRGIKYILSGHSFRTEGITPLDWSYITDLRYINDIHKRFGDARLKKSGLLPMSKLLYYVAVKKIKYIPFLQYFDYSHEKVDKILTSELGWTYYGGHHHESLDTYFIQSYLLPLKFGIDKRKVEYSALIRSGQMTRKDAIEKLKEPYKYDIDIVEEVLKKLGYSQVDFQRIMSMKPKSFFDYSTYYPFIKLSLPMIKVCCNWGILPHVIYEKYQ